MGFTQARQRLSQEVEQFTELCETYRGPKESASSAPILITGQDEEDELAGFYEEEVPEASSYGSDCGTPASILAIRQSILGRVRGMNQAICSIEDQLKAQMTERESKR